MVAFFPAILCVTLVLLRIESASIMDTKLKRRIVLEGGILGVIVSIVLSFVFSTLNAFLFMRDGHGSMIGMAIMSLISIPVGIITGSFTSSHLVNKQSKRY